MSNLPVWNANRFERRRRARNYNLGRMRGWIWASICRRRP